MIVYSRFAEYYLVSAVEYNDEELIKYQKESQTDWFLKGTRGIYYVWAAVYQFWAQLIWVPK